MTFIAEWGDRSQLATIVLAGLNDVWGVVLGGCLGHTVCTGGAVLVGLIIARFLSARVLTMIGALVFLGFAIASVFTDPHADGIDGIPDIAVIIVERMITLILRYSFNFRATTTVHG